MDVATMQLSVVLEAGIKDIRDSLARIEQLLATRPAEESRSSVKINTTAKGEVQAETKVYSGDEAGADTAKVKAVEIFNALRTEVGA